MGVKTQLIHHKIISGGYCGSTAKKMVVGGWAFAWWMVTDVQRYYVKIYYY